LVDDRRHFRDNVRYPLQAIVDAKVLTGDFYFA